MKVLLFLLVYSWEDTALIQIKPIAAALVANGLQDGVSRKTIAEKRTQKGEKRHNILSSPVSPSREKPKGSRLLADNEWKTELRTNLVGSGSIPILPTSGNQKTARNEHIWPMQSIPWLESDVFFFPAAVDEAKFLAALLCCASSLLQETKQFATELGAEDAGAAVLGSRPDLEYAATSLRSLLSSRHHVAAQVRPFLIVNFFFFFLIIIHVFKKEFFSGPLAQLLFEQASVKYAASQVDQFITLAALSSDAANPDASFSLALHYLAEYERILRHNRKHDIDVENGPISKQIELWKTFWESVRYLWKAKGQGHPRARFLLFDLCSQITTVAQVFFF